MSHRTPMPTPHAVAVHWAMTRDDLNERSSELYAAVWANWLAWLDGHGLHWREARREHVSAFLRGAARGRKRRRPPKEVTTMANLTAQRYASLLERIYAYAVLMEWLETNPVLALGKKKPQVLPRSRKAEVLAPGVLDLLRSPAWLEAALPATKVGDWLPLRDRTLVALLANLGLTSAELSRLRPVDVREGTRRMPQDNEFAVMVGAAKNGPVIDILQPTKARHVSRTLPIPSTILPLLREWLRRRAQLDGLIDAGPLFPSRERAAGETLRGPVEGMSLYLVVQRCVFLAALESGHGDDVQAQGPAVVRNTVLQRWLQLTDDTTVANLAGLASTTSLRMERLPKPVR